MLVLVQSHKATTMYATLIPGMDDGFIPLSLFIFTSLLDEAIPDVRFYNAYVDILTMNTSHPLLLGVMYVSSEFALPDKLLP